MPNSSQAPETLIVVSGQAREPGHLDSPWIAEDHPSLAAIEMATSGIGTEQQIVFGGGEPTLRTDFLNLMESMPNGSILATDGLALHQEPLIKRLTANGFSHARIPFHSARADAHNWLVGIPGAHKRVCRAMAALQTNDVKVCAEVTLTRPTMPYLEETVAYLYRSGIREIRFRMLERRGASTDVYITLAPRIGLLEPAIEAAILVALRHDMKVTLHGLPHCATPRFHDLHRHDATVVLPEGMTAPESSATPTGGCDGCPPSCLGAPQSYVDLFGWTEFGSVRGEMPADNHAVHKPESGPDVPAPPPRSNRTPSTRVNDAVAQSMRYDLNGDPIIGLPVHAPPAVVAVRFPANEPTRSIRKRLVQASQQGAETLQIVGDLNHPNALELLREAQRLAFSRVIFSGDVTGLTDAPANKLFHLRGLHLVQVPADKENLEMASRIHATASVPTQTYLTLSGNNLPTKLAGRWATEGWPGAPCFAIAQDANHSALETGHAQLTECPEKAALDMALRPSTIGLFGAPGTPGIVAPTTVGWPKVPSFTVE